MTNTEADTLLADRDSLSLIADYQLAGQQMTGADESSLLALAKVRGWITASLEARGDDGLLWVAEGLCPLCLAEIDDCDCDEGSDG